MKKLNKLLKKVSKLALRLLGWILTFSWLIVLIIMIYGENGVKGVFALFVMFAFLAIMVGISYLGLYILENI